MNINDRKQPVIVCIFFIHTSTEEWCVSLYGAESIDSELKFIKSLPAKDEDFEEGFVFLPEWEQHFNEGTYKVYFIHREDIISGDADLLSTEDCKTAEIAVQGGCGDICEENELIIE